MCRTLFQCTLALIALLVLGMPATGVHAQIYPNKTIKLIVPWPAGGGADVFARIMAQKLSDQLGQQMVVDNRPGAGSSIGMEMVAKAPPDGYTLGACSTSLASNVTLYPKLGYDPVTDLTPIAMGVTFPFVLVVNAASAHKSVKDLVAAAKAKPGEMIMGSNGNGAALHLMGALFAHTAGIDVIHVPFKGEAPATTDLIGGRVEFLFLTSQSAGVHVKGGRLRALAVSSAKRWQQFPEVPTFIESGFSALDAPGWFCFAGPAKLPAAIVTKLNGEIIKALAAPEVKVQLDQHGLTAAAGSPAEFAAYLKSEIAKWGKVVKVSGATAD